MSGKRQKFPQEGQTGERNQTQPCAPHGKAKTAPTRQFLQNPSGPTSPHHPQEIGPSFVPILGTGKGEHRAETQWHGHSQDASKGRWARVHLKNQIFIFYAPLGISPASFSTCLLVFMATVFKLPINPPPFFHAQGWKQRACHTAAAQKLTDLKVFSYIYGILREFRYESLGALLLLSSLTPLLSASAYHPPFTRKELKITKLFYSQGCSPPEQSRGCICASGLLFYVQARI